MVFVRPLDRLTTFILTLLQRLYGCTFVRLSGCTAVWLYGQLYGCAVAIIQLQLFNRPILCRQARS